MASTEDNEASMKHVQPTDEDLVAAAQAGNSAAQSQLYDRYFPPLYAFVYRHVDHVQDAEDLTSEVVIRMIKHLASFNRASTFKTWLFGIARNVIADFWRKRYRLPENLVAEYVGAGTVELYHQVVSETNHTDVEALLMDEQRVRAEKVFQALSENYRQVLQHRFIEQRTLAETAAAMNITTDNVKVLQYRALKKAAQLAKELV